VGSRGPAMRRRLRPLLPWLALALAAGALVLAAGCGFSRKLTGTQLANQPPHTVLFVNGAIDTVNHVVRLFWVGSDQAGTISGLEGKRKPPAPPADTAWHFTTRTDSVFTIQAPSGYTNPLFSVRAIDNKGARDPHPPQQRFEFSNQAPTVKLVQKPL